MEDYVSNSHKSKKEEEIRERKKLEKVVVTPVKQRKKSELKKLTDIFIAEDISNVKSYIIRDVIVPAIKDAIEDVVHMILRGDSGKSRKEYNGSKVSYRKYYDKERDRERGRYSDVPSYLRSDFDCEEYILGSRGEAEAVLSQMDDLIDVYGVVSVADFCDLLGVGCSYTANKYGWTNIRNAQIVRTRNEDGDYGYMIKFPKVMPLN